MIKICLIGCGRGGIRFLESAQYIENFDVTVLGFNIKNKSKNNANFFNAKFDYFELKSESYFSEFDIVIISTPPKTRIHIVEKLINYRGKIVFDKPFAESLIQYENLERILDNKWFTFYSRDFIKIADFKIRDINIVRVPINLIDDDVDPLMVLIPHIINLIIKKVGLSKFKVKRYKNTVFLKYASYFFYINFSTKYYDFNGILFNNDLLKWPQFQIAYFNFFTFLINNEIIPCTKDVDRKISEILENVK